MIILVFYVLTVPTTNDQQPEANGQQRRVMSRAYILKKRPVTQLPLSRGLAGARIEVFGHLCRSSELKMLRNADKVKRGPTDQQTNRKSGV